MKLNIIDDDKKIFGRITNAFRKIWMTYSSERKAVVMRNRKHYVNPKTNKQKYFNSCEICGKVMYLEIPQIHHKNPVGSIKDGVDSYLSKLFCDRSELIILCKDCHKKEHVKLKNKTK